MRLKQYLLLLMLPFFVFSVVLMRQGIVHAAPPPFNRGQWQGYFDPRDNAQWGDNLADKGIHIGSSIDAFVKFYSDELNNGKDPRHQIAAAFTILTMLGEPAGSKWTDAQTRFSEWEDDVRWYAANNWIGWSDDYKFDYNTYLQNGADDVAWYANSNKLPSIVFYSPDGSTYAIKIDCANPVGQMTPITPKPKTQVQCGVISVTPQNPEVTDAITITATVTYTGGPNPPAPSNMQLSVAGVPSAHFVGFKNPVPPNGATYTLLSNSFHVPSAGRYVVSWSMKVNGVDSGTCGNDINANTSVFDVFNYPYLDIEGGDVAAGSRFATDVVAPGNSCGASNTKAGIASWNKGGPAYQGAGTQYGASTFNFIQDFITNKGNSNGGGPDSLSFANQDAPLITPDSDNTGAGRYGGFYNQGPCVDYWSKKPASNPLPTDKTNTHLPDLGSGVYVDNGPLTINTTAIANGMIANGTHLTIYINGDVNIKGTGIRYAGAGPGGWTSTADIPIFQLIVKGNIYIDGSVTQLDGSYVAVPNSDYATNTSTNDYASPRAGTISTCSNGFNVENPMGAPVSVAAMIAACKNPLVVNGAFAANQVLFLRTVGTKSNGQPAEQFNFSPDLWLAPAGTGAVDSTYKSVVGLPPVL